MTAATIDLDAALVFTAAQGWHLQPSPQLETEVEERQARRRRLAAAPTAAPCPDPSCGQERHTPGRPRAGWVKAQITGAHGLWFCGWRCLSTYARRQASQS